MNKKTFRNFLFLLICLPSMVMAGLEPTWTLALDQNVNWQKITSYGYYIVHAEHHFTK